MIDKHSSIPIYYQIEEIIRAQIDNMTLKPGDLLPSERELAEKYQISRMTARHALTNLVNQQLLYREKGKGTFVAHKKIAQPLSGLTSFTEDMEGRGMKTGNRVVDFQIEFVPNSIATELGINNEKRIYIVKRVRLADDKPIAYETSYIPVDLIPDLTLSVFEQSFYQYVEENLGLAIDYGTQSIESALATAEEKHYLQLETQSPILFISRQTFLKDGRILELAHTSYCADRYQMTTTLKRHPKGAPKSE